MEDNRAPDEAERRQQLYGGCDKSVKQIRLADYLAKEYHVIATACKRFHRNSGAQCHTMRAKDNGLSFHPIRIVNIRDSKDKTWIDVNTT